MSTSARQTPSHEVWQRPFVKAHQGWCDDFVLELRLRDVPGRVIGDRLAEVERHCAEAGETPPEAFGEPTRYAGQIDRESSPERVSGVWKVTVVSTAQVLAMLVGTAAIPVWARGASLTYNVGQVVCFGLTMLVLLSLPWLLRPLLRHSWELGVLLVAVVSLGAGGAVLSGRSDLPTVDQLSAPAVSVGLFLVVLVLAWVEYRELSRCAEGDLVTSPLAATHGQLGTARVRERGAALLPACMTPVAYLVLATSGWLLA